MTYKSSYILTTEHVSTYMPYAKSNSSHYSTNLQLKSFVFKTEQWYGISVNNNITTELGKGDKTFLPFHVKPYIVFCRDLTQSRKVIKVSYYPCPWKYITHSINRLKVVQCSSCMASP